MAAAASFDDGDLSFERFCALSKTVDIRYSREDGAFQTVMASLQSVSGIYCFENRDRVLRLGRSNSGLGQRMLHHLKEGYGDQPSRTRQFPDYYQFLRRVIDRPLVVRYLAWPKKHTLRVERCLLEELGDRILWQKLQGEKKRGNGVDWDAVTRWFEEPLTPIPTDADQRSPQAVDAPIAPAEPTPLGTQMVGNIGLYFVCYRLSQLGWNVMPTARNARGIDVLAYSQDGKRVRTIQVKALTSRNAVVLGTNLESFIAEFVVVCRRVRTGNPECFVLTTPEVIERVHRGGNDAKPTYWLETKAYEGDEFRERWEKVGEGF